ncbi:hypothetical protein ABZ260_33385 [Streptosporangium sp. NPDC006013]|uniref:hypothetical protein n=1 Tax=Streptosporangium sp. NPDC006013 TaxID=3155596 RepID=UPI00339FA867
MSTAIVERFMSGFYLAVLTSLTPMTLDTEIVPSAVAHLGGATLALSSPPPAAFEPWTVVEMCSRVRTLLSLQP